MKKEYYVYGLISLGFIMCISCLIALSTSEDHKFERAITTITAFGSLLSGFTLLTAISGLTYTKKKEEDSVSFEIIKEFTDCHYKYDELMRGLSMFKYTHNEVNNELEKIALKIRCYQVQNNKMFDIIKRDFSLMTYASKDVNIKWLRKIWSN